MPSPLLSSLAVCPISGRATGAILATASLLSGSSRSHSLPCLSWTSPLTGASSRLVVLHSRQRVSSINSQTNCAKREPPLEGPHNDSARSHVRRGRVFLLRIPRVQRSSLH